MALIHLWDGAKSIGAAGVTLGLCGVPCYYTFRAIQIGLAPAWVWIALIGLAFVGILMVIAFLRKGFDGVSPSRDRRRRVS